MERGDIHGASGTAWSAGSSRLISETLIRCPPLEKLVGLREVSGTPGRRAGNPT
jgi:hypothetical protein